MNWSKEEVVYCSNVHPYDTLKGLMTMLRQHAIPIKSQRNLASMDLGLWLNENLAQEMIASPCKMQELLSLFQQERFSISTLNAFPQQSFHGQHIKNQVYLPDWSSAARYKYTLTLLQIIEQYPELFGDEVSISTLPLGYALGWSREKQSKANVHLSKIAENLADTKAALNKHVILCLEMEPDCVLETSQQMISFFKDELNHTKNTAVKSHIGLCYDICHQAVMNENHVDNFQHFSDNEIRIGKIQVSNAITFKHTEKETVLTELSPYFNSPYLHQVKSYSENEQSASADISPSYFTVMDLKGFSNVHLHVPINRTDFTEHIKTTQSHIHQVLDALQSNEQKPHLEVETYTWSILQKKMTSTQLNQAIVEECDWLIQALENRKMISYE